MKLKYIFTICLFIFFILIFKIFPTYSQVMTPQVGIGGSVRVNICGDMMAEGMEQCDRTDLRGLSCTSFGFYQGNLLCNLICEFDFSGCSMEPEPEVPTEESDQEEGVVERPSITFIEETIRRYFPTRPRYEYDDTKVSDLPPAVQFLKYFDENDNGIIESNELPILVLSWVNGWKYSHTEDISTDVTCDLNNDSVCDLVDFSILMFNLGEAFYLSDYQQRNNIE